METFLIIFCLLALIGLSNILNRIMPAIPVPLFQVALGALFAAFPTGIYLDLEPELFFILFIAPLLYNDGMRTPREELWKLRGSILALAVGLVFATVLLGGYGIHAMAPAIPLSAAFALAAILSPTDAVAVGALSGRIKLPKGILRLLEGEALMNDASGLVAFKFAVAATLTGVFSLPKAALSFIVIAVGGLLCGVVLSVLRMILVKSVLRRLGIEDVTMRMLIQILTPFALYLVAEEIGVSGILAVVGGGLFHAFARDRMEPAMTKFRVVSSSTWTVLLFILNGLVFLIMGLQIPGVTMAVLNDPKLDNFQAIGYVAVITIGLYGLRFVWVHLFNTFVLKIKPGQSSWETSLLTSLSGVRGAVTLAGALSIPLVLQDGTPFPQRDLMIFLSAWVILATLLIASTALPLFVRRERSHGEEDMRLTERTGQIRLLEMTIQALKEEINAENRKAVLSVIADYQGKLLQFQSQPEAAGRCVWQDSYKRVQLLALETERQEMERLLNAGEIEPEVARAFEKVQAHTEVLILGGRFQWVVKTLQLALRKLWRRLLGASPKEWGERTAHALKKLKVKTSKAAIMKLKPLINEEEPCVVLSVITFYHKAMDRIECSLTSSEQQEEFEDRKRDMEFKAIQMQRDGLQKLYAEGDVSLTTLNNLRYFVNTMEAAITEEEELE